MCHYRDKIEGCVKDILWDQTMAKQRVFSVSEAVYNQNFPMIILFCPKETVMTPGAPQRPFRQLSLDIVGIIKGHKDLMAQSHLLAKQIEEAIALDTEMFPSFVQQVDLTTSQVEMDPTALQGSALAASQAEDPSACLQGYVKITYTINYRAGHTSFSVGTQPPAGPPADAR